MAFQALSVQHCQLARTAVLHPVLRVESIGLALVMRPEQESLAIVHRDRANNVSPIQ